MLKEATPKPSTTAVPSTVVPFLNVTLPGVGVNPVGEVMVAVNVTLVFTAAVVAEELRAMTVVALFTSSVKMGELLARCVASPLYTVVIRCAEKEPIRQKLSQVLSRSFSLGGSSFALTASEARRVLQHTKPEGSTMPEATTTRS